MLDLLVKTPDKGGEQLGSRAASSRNELRGRPAPSTGQRARRSRRLKKALTKLSLESCEKTLECKTPWLLSMSHPYSMNAIHTSELLFALCLKWGIGVLQSHLAWSESHAKQLVQSY